MYTKDKTKLLPRPISICEIDKEQGRLHLVYRVTGENTGTEEFSRLQPGDTPVSYTHLGVVVYKKKKK